MYYVTMTDTFLSGWGKAENKTNILVVKCETREEAEEVKTLNENRDCMENVEILLFYPHIKENELVTLAHYCKDFRFRFENDEEEF